MMPLSSLLSGMGGRIELAVLHRVNRVARDTDLFGELGLAPALLGPEDADASARACDGYFSTWSGWRGGPSDSNGTHTIATTIASTGMMSRKIIQGVIIGESLPSRPRVSTNSRDPASAVFCGEVGAADAPFGRQRHAAARS